MLVNLLVLKLLYCYKSNKSGQGCSGSSMQEVTLLEELAEELIQNRHNLSRSPAGLTIDKFRLVLVIVELFDTVQTLVIQTHCSPPINGQLSPRTLFMWSWSWLCDSHNITKQFINNLWQKLPSVQIFESFHLFGIFFLVFSFFLLKSYWVIFKLQSTWDFQNLNTLEATVSRHSER